MTSTETTTEIVLKSDGLGRIRTPRDVREAMLDEFERSGMSGAAFARTHGVKYSTFAYWISRRRKQRETAASVEMAEVVIVPEGPDSGEVPQADGSGLVIEWPGGSRTVVRTAVEVELAAGVLRALDRQNGCSC